ncbi:MAG: chemotaxis protein CheY [Acidimicrobiales bacterium]|nr:chemotaxis protein CheY [Acidimicrobiales bacterium]
MRRAAVSRTGHVLVVNDDTDACEIVARVIEAAGHEATRSHGHDEAVGLVANSGIDVVVIDLPGSGAGVHLLETLRTRPDEASSTVRVVVVGAGPANALFCWQSGADEFLVRPLDATELQEAVATVLTRPESARASYRATAQRALQ